MMLICEKSSKSSDFSCSLSKYLKNQEIGILEIDIKVVNDNDNEMWKLDTE